MRAHSQFPWAAAAVAAAAAALLVAGAPGDGGGQVVYRTGQDIAPAFDGWEQRPDGTFDLAFGYFNRNWDEKPFVPVGPDNNVEPGGPDQGQPTLFQPRRNRFVFRINVPADFGEREIVWTLTVNGKTNRTYGSLLPGYITDPQLQQFDIGDFGHNNEEMRANLAPTVRVEGSLLRTVAVGQPLALAAVAADDGIPPVHAAPLRLVGRHGAWGLRVAWIVYRGPESHVRFDPYQFKTYPDYRSNSPWTPGWEPPPLPADGHFLVTATFSRPGEYVIRAQAHDGGLKDTEDVTVTVTP